MFIEKVVSYIVSVLIIISIPYTVYFNIEHFRAKWKCRKKGYQEFFNPCHEENCKWARHCDKYEHLYTAEEIQQLYDIIDNYQQKIEKEKA